MIQSKGTQGEIMDNQIEYSQPTNAPVAKVTAVAVSGVIVTILTLIAGAFDVTLPSNLTDNITQLIAGVVALSTLVNFVAAYFKKDVKPLEVVEVIEGTDI